MTIDGICRKCGFKEKVRDTKWLYWLSVFFLKNPVGPSQDIPMSCFIYLCYIAFMFIYSVDISVIIYLQKAHAM